GVSGAGVGAMFPGASLDAGTLPATSGFMSFPMVLDGGFGIGPCSMCMVTQPSSAQSLPWTPPFDHVGASGWKQSSGSLCSGYAAIVGLDVWSSDRGVFVAVSGTLLSPSPVGLGLEDDAGVLISPSDAGAADSNPRTTIWHNEGSGWQETLDDSSVYGAFEITGVRSSALFLNDPTNVQSLNTMPPDPKLMGPPSGGACALGVVRGAALECNDVDPVQAVFAVDATLTYAVMGGTRLLIFDGTHWRSAPALIPYPVVALWADRQTVIAVGRSGTVLRLQQGQWTLDDPGTLEHLSAVWAKTTDDVWVGTEQGRVLHYDGASWTEIGKLGGVSCSAVTPIRGIWGAGSSVYIHTGMQLARWDGANLTSLGNWACATTQNTTITGLWGNDERQVFLTIADASRSSEVCGAAFVVSFDGTEFHRM
ncbi:MAG: hypothetical protein ACHQ53_18265, partial [Polyangiales bacterium]